MDFLFLKSCNRLKLFEGYVVRVVLVERKGNYLGVCD